MSSLPKLCTFAQSRLEVSVRQAFRQGFLMLEQLRQLLDGLIGVCRSRPDLVLKNRPSVGSVQRAGLWIAGAIFGASADLRVGGDGAPA